MTASIPRHVRRAPTADEPRKLTRETHPVTVGASRVRRFSRWVGGPARVWTVAAFARARSVILQAVGLGLIAYGLFMLHPVAGFVAAGAALFVIEWVIREDTPFPPGE